MLDLPDRRAVTPDSATVRTGLAFPASRGIVFGIGLGSA